MEELVPQPGPEEPRFGYNLNQSRGKLTSIGSKFFSRHHSEDSRMKKRKIFTEDQLYPDVKTMTPAYLL